MLLVAQAAWKEVVVTPEVTVVLDVTVLVTAGAVEVSVIVRSVE